MSVIIKGMDMPTSCFQCNFKTRGMCMILIKRVCSTNKTVDEHCPLESADQILENQKIGHWIRQKGIYGLADTCECSVCGRTIYAGNENDLKDYPYCHCGAKMEGE